MRKNAHPVAGESRWLPVSVAIVAAAFLPSPALAVAKLDNAKPFLSAAVLCPTVPSYAPAIRYDASRVILGGAPSALERIRADQQGAASAIQPSAPITAGLAALPVRRTLEPASRGPVPSFTAPVGFSCDGRTAFHNPDTPPISDSFADLNRELGGDGAYDAMAELGTRAIPVKRTRFDARWDRVRRAAPAALMQAQLRRADAAGLKEADLLARINQWVNREIAYINDDRNYRERDFWATAEQTIARGSGDCEDFAILKMQLLRAAGVDADRMKLVLLRDLAANSDHAFLLVQTDSGKVVLDNMTDRLYDGSRANSVRPVLSFSENRRWVHAYRGTQPSPNLVSIPAARQPVTLALNDQRSVKADPLTFKTGFNR